MGLVGLKTVQKIRIERDKIVREQEAAEAKKQAAIEAEIKEAERLAAIEEEKVKEKSERQSKLRTLFEEKKIKGGK